MFPTLLKPTAQVFGRKLVIDTDCKPIRTSLFIGLSASGFAPVAHMTIVEGMAGLQNFPIQKWCIMALFYLAGAVVYVARVPEKFFPGTFDIWVSENEQTLFTPSEQKKNLPADKNIVCGV